MAGEAAELRRLLLKVAYDGGYWPDEATLRAAHGVISAWAPELVIRRSKNLWEKEILLAVYKGGAEWFNGKWHIPGGYNLWPEQDVQATCSRTAKREIGVDVTYQRTIDIYKWRTGEHPYGHPLSLYVECVPAAEVVESEKLRFFSKSNLPDNIVIPHRRFIEEYL